jgi:hypothetical protein
VFCPIIPFTKNKEKSTWNTQLCNKDNHKNHNLLIKLQTLNIVVFYLSIPKTTTTTATATKEQP